MATPVYTPGSNPFSAGNDFPSTAAGVTLPGGVSAVICDYPHVASVAFENIVVRSWSGKEKRAAKVPARKKFVLRFEMCTPTEMDTLWNHYLAQSGTLTQFTYKEYNSGESFTCRYENESLDRETFVFEAEKTGITLIQVL